MTSWIEQTWMFKSINNVFSIIIDIVFATSEVLLAVLKKCFCTNV